MTVSDPRPARARSTEALATAALVALLAAAPLAARGFEVKLELPLRPKLSLSGEEKILVAPFLIGSKGDEKREGKLDIDREFRRYLEKQLGRRTRFRLAELPDGTRLPSADLSKVKADVEFWKELGTKTGTDLVITGSIEWDVEDRSGYRREEYVSPIDGRTYYRQVLVNETGFGFDIVLVVFDAKSGTVLFEDNFKDFRTREGQNPDELAGLFDNLFSLESRILGIFVSRRTEARRFVFEN